MARLDMIIFGASGFTGKYTVKHLISVLKKTGSNFTWGVAGRNKEKILNCLKEVAAGEVDVSKIPIIIADVNDYNSLEEMAKQAKVVLNCCGPYRFYGEAVVKACIASKTHHVDVNGEPQFMETMQVRYDEKAKENEVYVISACGFDSIPADLGTVFLKNEFRGELNSVEIFLESWVTGKKTGSTVHYGTWQSAIYSVGCKSELKSIRKELFTKPLPNFSPKLRDRFPFTRCEELDGKWCLPFPGSDTSVVRRSQYLFYQNEKERPVQVATYLAYPTFLSAILVLLASAIFGALVRFDYGRKLLLTYPKLLSFGFASHEGPPEDEAENTHFTFTFCGEGWKEKMAEPTDVHMDKPDKKMVTRVSATNPGYGATCIFLITSALTILEEHNKMPDVGGVFPPAAAFAKTSMIKKLQDLGIKFEVVYGME